MMASTAVTLAVAGAGAGAGLALIVSGLRPARPSLAAAIDALRRPPPAPLPAADRLAAAVTSPLRRLGLPRASVRADLAILDRDPARHLLTQLGSALLGFLAPAATLAALSVMGADLGGAVPLWLCLILAAAGFIVPDLSIHEEAEERRLLMRHTLAALLDIVPPSLAAGAGIEQALGDASRIASGWAAEKIRDALHTAQVTRAPIWQPLRALGEQTGVVQLQQLAGSLELAAGEGARIRDALTQRGDALAEGLTTDMEAHAAAATERMSVPLMGLAGVFMLFLIYPAIAGIHV